MSEYIQFLDLIFSPLILLFTVSNLFVMGLQANMPEVIVALKNKKSMALIFVWGWVLGPALAYLITRVLPLAEPFVVVVLLCSLAPCAPFLPPMVGKARGDVSFAGAFVPLVAVGTVVFMPLIAPLLIKGLTISTVALAEPLFLTLLVPLIIGAAIRHYADATATKIFPAAKGFALLTTLGMMVSCVALYGPGDASHGGQLCPPLYDNLHGRDGTDHVSIRFRPETESAKRHGAGYAHT